MTWVRLAMRWNGALAAAVAAAETPITTLLGKSRFVRASFSVITPDEIREGIRRFAEVLKEAAANAAAASATAAN